MKGRDLFQEALEGALAELPREFREKMGTVQVVVQDWPSDEQLANAGAEPDTGLYGLFEGVPLLEKSITDPQLYPDRVTIFRGPLTEDFPDPAELQREIRTTLIHELGHYCGFDEDDLAAKGYA